MNVLLVMLTQPFFSGTPVADAVGGKGLTSKIFLQKSIVVQHLLETIHNPFTY